MDAHMKTFGVRCLILNVSFLCILVVACSERVHRPGSQAQRHHPNYIQHFNKGQLKKQAGLSAQSGQSSYWYRRWLALRKGRQPPQVQEQVAPNDANIQSDVPGCRDDLCIADELDQDYFDGGSESQVSSVDLGDVPCPQGYEAIYRSGVIYCDVIKETSKKSYKAVECADDHEAVFTGGVIVCIPKPINPPVVTTEQPNNSTTCKPDETLVNTENGFKACVKNSSINKTTKFKNSTESPAMNTSPNSVKSDCPPGKEAVKTDSGFRCQATTVLPLASSSTRINCPQGEEQSPDRPHECVPLSSVDGENQNVAPDDNMANMETNTPPEGLQNILNSEFTASLPTFPFISSLTERGDLQSGKTRDGPYYTAVTSSPDIEILTDSGNVATDMGTDSPPKALPDNFSSEFTDSPLIFPSAPSLNGKVDYKAKQKSGKPIVGPSISTVTSLPNTDKITTKDNTANRIGTSTPLEGLPENHSSGFTGSTPAFPSGSLTSESENQSKQTTIETNHGASSVTDLDVEHFTVTNSLPNISPVLPSSSLPDLNSLPPLTGEHGYHPNGKSGVNKGFEPNGNIGIDKHPLDKKHTGAKKGVPPFSGQYPLTRNWNSNEMSGKMKKKNITNLKGIFPIKGKGKLGIPMVELDSKTSVCGVGKVLAGTPYGGYECVEPVFPRGVCPEDRVPHLSSMGIQCIPCPFGQYPTIIDEGIKCVAVPTLPTVEDVDKQFEEDLAPCPDGLLPFDTPSGIICRFVPPSVPVEHQPCPPGEFVVFIDGKKQCHNHDNRCPPGLVALVTETGEEVCGFDSKQHVEDCNNIIDGDCPFSKTMDNHDEFIDNFCPPGLEVVLLDSGQRSCQYIIVDQTEAPPTLPVSRCGSAEIPTQTAGGFYCQPVEMIPDHMGCSDGEVLVRLGPTFDCITEHESSLVCNESEELIRLQTGFVCRRLTNGSNETPCGPDRVVDTDQNGHVQCITLLEAGENCGEGFTAVRDGDSFMCKQQTLDLKCPEWFMLKLVRAKPACVSIKNPDCQAIDGSMSTLCLTDLEMPDQLDLDIDAMLEPKMDCGEGQIPNIVDGTFECTDEVLMDCGIGQSASMVNGKLVCTDEAKIDCGEGRTGRMLDGTLVCMEEGMVDPAGQTPCEKDDVRPCDLDLSILLEGCNPDCANGGTCVNGSCHCPPGITGIGCSEDINECVDKAYPLCEYRCENTFGSYQCVCPVGKVIGRNGLTCEEPGCIPDCLNGAQCVQGICQCPEGFEGDYCQIDKDECGSYGERLCEYYCRNTYGGYQCICPPGSRLNEDRRTCTNTTCIPKCRNGGSCENHKCVCPPGFYGFVCQLDINECYRQAPCQGTCMNTWGSYKCICDHGKRLGPDGHSCI